jgi:hypothetical protein
MEVAMTFLGMPSPRRSSRLVALMIAALLVIASSVPVEAAIASLPVLTRARAELSEGRLFLEGGNLGQSPRVLLGAPGGGFDELVVLSSTGELVEAELPAI